MLLAVAAILILLAFGFYAKRVKADLDAPLPATGARADIELPADDAARLRLLSPEPILMKQSEEGLRVQLDTRPMVPIAAFAGMDVRPSLVLAAAQVTEQFGPQWAALVTTRDDGQVSALRIS